MNINVTTADLTAMEERYPYATNFVFDPVIPHVSLELTGGAYVASSITGKTGDTSIIMPVKLRYEKDGTTEITSIPIRPFIEEIEKYELHSFGDFGKTEIVLSSVKVNENDAPVQKSTSAAIPFLFYFYDEEEQYIYLEYLPFLFEKEERDRFDLHEVLRQEDFSEAEIRNYNRMISYLAREDKKPIIERDRTDLFTDLFIKGQLDDENKGNNR